MEIARRRGASSRSGILASRAAGRKHPALSSLAAFEGVVPVTPQGTVLDAEAAANRGFSGLHGWMSDAEAIWNAREMVEKFR